MSLRPQVPPMLPRTPLSPSCPDLPSLLLPANPARACPAQAGPLRPAALPAPCQPRGSGASVPSRCQAGGGRRCETAADGRRCRPWHEGATALPPSPGGVPLPGAAAGSRGQEGAIPTQNGLGTGSVAVPFGPSSPGMGRARRAPGSWIGAASPRRRWPDNSGNWPKMWF